MYYNNVYVKNVDTWEVYPVNIDIDLLDVISEKIPTDAQGNWLLSTDEINVLESFTREYRACDDLFKEDVINGVRDYFNL